MVTKQKISVLGAGIQGTCIALALARAGYEVSLFEQEDDCLLRASLRNEGKLHLGFTYANDPSFRTSQLMLESAVRFRLFFDRLLAGQIDWDTLLSPPFTYLVLKDSLRSPTEVMSHFERISAKFREIDPDGQSYPGAVQERIWSEIQLPLYVSSDDVECAIETAEVAINLDAFRQVLSRHLRTQDRITLCYRTKVEEVRRVSNGFITSVRGCDGEQRSHESDLVVNCLWDQRMAIDAQLGICAPNPWVHRLKYRLLSRLPKQLAHIPPLTMVLGAFGDIVPMGCQSYVSWYPACRQGWSSDLAPPQDWDAACRGVVADEIRKTLPMQVYGSLSKIVPGMENTVTTGIDAGVVVSRGSSDIDKLESELHRRSDVGITQSDGYFSVDTGKFVCAPLFAETLVAELCN